MMDGFEACQRLSVHLRNDHLGKRERISELSRDRRFAARGGRQSAVYAIQLENLNYRRGISNSTDYVLITRRVAGNVE